MCAEPSPAPERAGTPDYSPARPALRPSNPGRKTPFHAVTLPSLTHGAISATAPQHPRVGGEPEAHRISNHVWPHGLCSFR